MTRFDLAKIWLDKYLRFWFSKILDLAWLDQNPTWPTPTVSNDRHWHCTLWYLDWIDYLLLRFESTTYMNKAILCTTVTKIQKVPFRKCNSLSWEMKKAWIGLMRVRTQLVPISGCPSFCSSDPLAFVTQKDHKQLIWSKINNWDFFNISLQ